MRWWDKRHHYDMLSWYFLFLNNGISWDWYDTHLCKFYSMFFVQWEWASALQEARCQVLGVTCDGNRWFLPQGNSNCHFHLEMGSGGHSNDHCTGVMNAPSSPPFPECACGFSHLEVKSASSPSWIQAHLGTCFNQRNYCRCDMILSVALKWPSTSAFAL